MADASKPLILEDVVINGYCTSEQWTLLDFDQLAYLIAVIALGQAQHVAVVLAGLDPGSPVLGLAELKDQAKKVLTVAPPNAFRQRTRSGTSDGTDRSRRTFPSLSMMQTATERSDTSNAA
jgi:hypothetical protein